MTKDRLEAFSDGVLAIIITIMVLELKAPHDPSPAALVALAPVLLSYLLSFIYIGIYWNNHHHMFHAIQQVSGGVLWANLHLLFWLSLIPFVTAWMGENKFAQWPVFFYALVLLCSAAAYAILARTLIAANGRESPLARAIGTDIKGNVSLAVYVASLLLTFWNPRVACIGFVVVALMWLVPDRRIEKEMPEIK